MAYNPDLLSPTASRSSKGEAMNVVCRMSGSPPTQAPQARRGTFGMTGQDGLSLHRPAHIKLTRLTPV